MSRFAMIQEHRTSAFEDGPRRAGDLAAASRGSTDAGINVLKQSRDGSAGDSSQGGGNGGYASHPFFAQPSYGFHAAAAASGADEGAEPYYTPPPEDSLNLDGVFNDFTGLLHEMPAQPRTEEMPSQRLQGLFRYTRPS
ncbi:MAG: hypothetical protein AAF772_03165 [Acidobacteriota bacterium]